MANASRVESPPFGSPPFGKLRGSESERSRTVLLESSLLEEGGSSPSAAVPSSHHTHCTCQVHNVNRLNRLEHVGDDQAGRGLGQCEGDSVKQHLAIHIPSRLRRNFGMAETMGADSCEGAQ